MNNHEKEQYFNTKKIEMEDKYIENIESFCNYHNVDLFIGFDMLFLNARCFANGLTENVVAGGGVVNVPELVRDYNELMQYVTIVE